MTAFPDRDGSFWKVTTVLNRLLFHVVSIGEQTASEDWNIERFMNESRPLLSDKVKEVWELVAKTAQLPMNTLVCRQTL